MTRRAWPALDAEEWRHLRDEPLAGERDAEAPPAVPPSPGEEYHSPRWTWKAPPEDRFGLALSGGGIRSATFSLGLLQRLAERGLLGGFHYLSTVSGGGYLGGFLSAWRYRRGHCKPPLPSAQFPQPRLDEPEPREVRHLREFSNFLQPRLTLLSFETGRVVAAIVAAVLPALFVAFSVLVLAWLLWLGLGWLLVSEEVADLVLLRLPLFDLTLPAAAAFALVAFVQLSFEWLWTWQPQESGAHRPAAFAVTALFAAAAVAAAAGFLAALAPRPFGDLLRPLPEGGADAGHVAMVLLPAVAFAAGVVLLVTVRALVSRGSNRGHRARLRLGTVDRAIARLVLLAAVWVVAGAAWVAAQWIAAGGPVAALSTTAAGGAGGGLYAWLRKRLFAEPNKPSGGRAAALAKPFVLKLIAYAAVAALAAGAGSLLVLLADATDGAALRRIVLPVDLGVLLLTALFFEPHEVGLHSFYRARIVRAFLGASNLSPPDQPPPPPRWSTADCERDDLPLSELPADRPLHLVCCAANDLSGDPLPTLARGAESAVLSRHGIQVADHWRPWPKSGDRRRWRLGPGPQPTLGDALTASAAAFNSQMGRVSMDLGPAASFLLSAVNARLGLWLENPGHADGRAARGWAALQRHLRGLLYFRELFAASRASSTWIHLSDGAHFENLALYELVRRHCRFILLSDCGADPDRAFDDFGNAVRRVREDFGVEIEIDVSPLRPGPDGLSRQPVVAGDIVYGPNDVGVLLYVKPTLTGDVPPDIANYARRNAAFPHETTIDQFYDEAQWESYRRLGAHAVDVALEGLRP